MSLNQHTEFNRGGQRKDIYTHLWSRTQLQNVGHYREINNCTHSVIIYKKLSI